MVSREVVRRAAVGALMPVPVEDFGHQRQPLDLGQANAGSAFIALALSIPCAASFRRLVHGLVHSVSTGLRKLGALDRNQNCVGGDSFFEHAADHVSDWRHA